MCRYLQCMVPRRPNAKQLCTVCGAAPWRRTCIWPMDSQPTRNSPHILEPKYHYRIHKYPLSVSILSQLDPVHTPPHPTSWNVMSPFRCLGRTRVSVQVRGCCKQFVTGYVFTVRNCQHLAQPPSWRTTHCRLSATAYSMYSQLPFILEAVPPSATWGRAMLWWQGPRLSALITLA